MTDQSIKELTNESVERIKSLADDQSKQAWARGQQIRLQIFDDVLGVNAQAVRQSADFKLRDRPELRKTVASLLTAVLANIDFCERFDVVKGKFDGVDSKRDRTDEEETADSGTGPRKRQQQGFDHGRTTADPFTLIELDGSRRENHALYSSALDRIKKDIGSLLRFTSLLRAQKPKSETQTIAKVIAARVQREMKLGEGEEDLGRAWLRAQLEETATRRWSRISYCKHRFVKRGAKAPATQIVVRGTRTQIQDHRPPVVMSGDNEPVSNQYLAVPGAPSKVSREATTVRSGLPATSNDQQQGPSTVVTTAVRDDGIIDLAPPLHIVHQSSSWEFICPLCRSAEIIKARGKVGFMKRWQKHALHDLAPYVCVVERCPTLLKTFQSVADWNRHRESAHSSIEWICEDCDIDARYTDKQAYIGHLTGPPRHIAAEQGELQFLAQTTARKVNQELFRCLVCNSSTGREENDVGKGTINNAPQHEAIVRCMLNQMQEIAITSLPEGLSLASSAGTVRGSISDSGHSGELEGYDGSSRVFFMLRRDVPPIEDIDVRIQDWRRKTEDAAANLERREGLLTQVQIFEEDYSGSADSLNEVKHSILRSDATEFAQLLSSSAQTGRTPFFLHLAALLNDVELAAELLEYGADPNVTCLVRFMCRVYEMLSA